MMVVLCSKVPETSVSVESQVNTRNGQRVLRYIAKVMIILVKASLFQNYCMITLLNDCSKYHIIVNMRLKTIIKYC
jgi:hypothetical protein